MCVWGGGGGGGGGGNNKRKPDNSMANVDRYNILLFHLALSRSVKVIIDIIAI